MLLPSQQKQQQQQQREQRQQPPPPPLTECWQHVAHPVDLQGQLQTAAPATATAAVPVPGQARSGWARVPSTRHIVFSLHTLLDFVNLLTIWSYFCMLYCQFGGHWPFTWLAPVACAGCLLSPCRLSTSLVRCLLLACAAVALLAHNAPRLTVWPIAWPLPPPRVLLPATFAADSDSVVRLSCGRGHLLACGTHMCHLRPAWCSSEYPTIAHLQIYWANKLYR